MTLAIIIIGLVLLTVAILAFKKKSKKQSTETVQTTPFIEQDLTLVFDPQDTQQYSPAIEQDIAITKTKMKSAKKSKSVKKAKNKQ